MLSPDSTQFGFYILVGLLMTLLGLQLLRWARQRLPSSRSTDNQSKSFDIHIIDGSSSHSSSQRQWQWNNLTPREMEIAQLVAQGKRNSEIAHDRYISVRTVEAHLTNIYAKLGVRSRTELSRLIRDLVD